MARSTTGLAPAPGSELILSLRLSPLGFTLWCVAFAWPPELLLLVAGSWLLAPQLVGLAVPLARRAVPSSRGLPSCPLTPQFPSGLLLLLQRTSLGVCSVTGNCVAGCMAAPGLGVGGWISSMTRGAARPSCSSHPHQPFLCDPKRGSPVVSAKLPHGQCRLKSS